MLKRLMLACVLFVLSGDCLARSLIFVCEDAEDYPYVLGSGREVQPERPGAAIEMIRLLGERIGVEIQIERYPWRRALEIELRGGTADALFYASHSREREEFGVFPETDGQVDPARALFRLNYYFYRPRESLISWDGHQLKGFEGRVGAPRGYSIVRDLQNMGLVVDESASTLLDMRKMRLGRVGLVAALEEQGDSLLAGHPELAEDIVKMEPAITSRDYYLLFSHSFVENNASLAEAIWTALEEIRDRKLPVILDRY